MKHYELFYLVSGSIPETEVAPIQKEVSGWISELGGTITADEAGARKRLAYPIKKEQNGYYILVEFDGEGTIVDELKKRLRLNTKVLRFLCIKKKPLSEKEIRIQEAAKKRALAKRIKADQPKEKEEVKKAVTDKKTESDSEEPKIKLEELDKKLDELLDQDIVN